MKTVDWKLGTAWADRNLVMEYDGKTFPAISFEWSGDHNVFQFEDEKSFKKCDFSKATEMATTSPYTFSASALGIYYFACGVEKHCENNLKLKLEVVSTITSSSGATPCQSKAEGEFMPQAK